MDISKTILSDPVNKWVFNCAQKLDTEAFIVGGYVRDLLRRHISRYESVLTKDKDFILSATGGFACGKRDCVKKIAIETAKKFNGTLITLKPQKTYRIVLKNRFREMLDFSYIENSIKNDLNKRDFTINAIAWSPKTGIIDPSGGREDLKRHIIRAVRIKNLIDDPLRLIRAYRIAAELDFKIDMRTRKNLKRFSGGLAKVAAERITEELFKILSNQNAVSYLNICYKDSVLGKIIYKKPEYLPENLKLLKKFDSFIELQLKKINESFVRINSHRKGKKITAFLNEETSQGLNKLGLMRLALLFKNSYILNSRLKVSNNINKAVRDIHRTLSVHNSYAAAMRKISDRELYKIFNASGERVFETAIILSFIKQKNIKIFLKRANEYIKIKNKILLNGNDIQKILNIKPGTQVGMILSALHEQQFKGLIKTRADAKNWILRNFT